MNTSGSAVFAVTKKYSVKITDSVVVYDDADLQLGVIRQKMAGSSAGHRGMESILRAFPPGANIARLRVGIGRPPHTDIQLEDFVLQQWSEQEEKQLPDIIAQAVAVIESNIS
jgi:PTH1 family peptidyl-tRNA hydrolase